jgi:hypothetical protein
MTIEFSLRRRATQARILAALWLSLATVILIATYISLPIIAGETLDTVSKVRSEASLSESGTSVGESQTKASGQWYALGTLALGLFSVSFACFLLGRSAFVEIELAARCSGFADALCIAGENFEQLEKAANILMPSTKYLSVPEIFSTNDLQSLVNILKQIRPG